MSDTTDATPIDRPVTGSSVPIAIVGIGAMFPKADGLERYWQNLQKGVDAITDVPETHWDVESYLAEDPKSRDMLYGAKGGFLDAIDFDPMEFGIAPRDLEATDTSQLLGLVAAKRALRDAGYGKNGKTFDRDRASVILGVTGALELVIPLGARLGHPVWRRALAEAGVPKELADDVVARISDSYPEWQENSFPGLLGNVVAGRIANRLDLHGTNCVVDAACASSMGALHVASMELASGKSDMVLAGGVDTFSDVFMYMCFSKTTALSSTGAARPFDCAGDGTILGEGVGIVVLKRLADAERDGDRVYAVLKGIGSSSDGKGGAVYAPKSDGQMRALRRAYAAADVSPETVELVEAHGTGTRVGDATELAALTEVYRDSRTDGQWAALGSVKSAIGHTKAAAGIAGLIKSALALFHKVVPPTLRITDPLEPLADGESPFYLPTEKRPWLRRVAHPRRAALSAFGFGGSNFHGVLEEHRSEKPGIDWDPDVEILPFAAASVEELRATVAAFPAEIEWDELARRSADARGRFDPLADNRLVLVIERDRTDLGSQLHNAQAMLKSRPKAKQWSTPDGAHFGHGSLIGKLAVLFPGQGSQYVGMLRDLACRFPAVQRALETADQAFELAASGLAGGVTVGMELSDRIFPQNQWNDIVRGHAEKLLRDTRVAQPAIGAVSVGALAALIGTFALAPQAYAGHSYGELSALSAAHGWNTAALIELSCLRGALMADGDGGRGAMLALALDGDGAVRFVEDGELRLSIANLNAPVQTVVSGERREIERAQELAAEQGVRATLLPVSAAFHSPLVADAARPLRDALADLPFAGETPVYANTTAEPYAEDADAARDLLAGQLVNSVDWTGLVERMHADGVHTFLEVGPGGRLTALVGRILEGREHAAVALDASSGKRSGMHDLAVALARLAAGGHGVALDAWNDGGPPEADEADAVRRLRIPICGANVMNPRPKRPKAPPMPVVRGDTAAPMVPASAPQAAPTPSATAPSAAFAAPAIGAALHAPASAVPPSPITRRPAEPPPRAAAEGGAALASLREQMTALLRMQEQTADVHRRFLEGQEAAQRALETLLRQQEALLGLPSGPSAHADGAVVAAPITAPAPALVAPPIAPIAAPAAAPTPTPAAGLDLGPLLLEVVCEKTGYPVEMLDLDMELDADLGIDSIKRVEILSAMQERVPSLPAVASDRLGALRTLGDVVAELGQLPVAASAPVQADAASSGPDLGSLLLEVVCEKTGYPVEMLDLDMELDADLGIDSIKRVEILSAMQERVPSLPAVASERLGALRTLGDVVSELGGSGDAVPAPVSVAPAPTAAPAAIERHVLTTVDLNGDVRERVAPGEGTILVACDGNGLGAAVAAALQDHGHTAQVVAVQNAGDLPERLAGLFVVAPSRGAGDAFLRDTLSLLVRAAPALREARGLFVTVSRLDGAFGLKAMNGADTTTAGLAGFAKTAAHEWPGVTCRALDVAPDAEDLETAAAAIVEEAFFAQPTEVGLFAPGIRMVPTLRAEALEDGNATPLAKGDLVVVSGGARGVTADVAVALAAEFVPALLVLGRSTLDDEPAWMAGLADESSLLREMIARGTGGGSPRAAKDAVGRVLAVREARANLDRMREAGAEVRYAPCDVRSPEAVAAAVADARATHGPVRGIVHGAGVLADSRIEDKTIEEFNRVYGTKVDGLRALLDAASADEPEDLRLLVVFSSSTGRFGRTGQIDYAAANEVLNKMSQREAVGRPACRVVSVNWGPWDGGMVDASLRRVFEDEGIQVIDRAVGARHVVREARASVGGAVEVVVLGEGSSAALAPPAPITAAPVAFERSVDIASHPVLRDHVVGGKAVLPVVLMIEWMAHGALHVNPGLRFHGLDDLRVLNGLKLTAEQSARVRVHVSAAPYADADGVSRVSVELRSDAGPRGDVLHARATALLVDQLPAAPAAPEQPAGEPIGSGALYPDQLFHGPLLRAIRKVDACGPDGIVGDVATAPRPGDWMESPLRGRFVTDPLALDGAFQLMVLWTRATRGAPSLPTAIGRLRMYASSLPRDGVRVVANVRRTVNSAATADLAFVEADGAVLLSADGYECVVDASLETAYSENALPVTV